MTLSVEEQIDAELDALSKRLAGIHSGNKERPAMKYALESLPELIGDQDFKDLCLLFKWHEVQERPISGGDFARHVREAAFKRRHQDQGLLESRKQSDFLQSPNQRLE
ncbi:hypothetical protein ShzoTeo12_36740 (plasmid) [Shinella zoogloeoides]|nr:hypothetical protein ShzoTeo12_36740 [Shinella zoogloeoides]